VKRLAAIAVLVVLSACSSAAEPGAQDVLNQVDKADKAAVDTALTDAARAEAAYLSIHGSYTTDVNALANEVDFRPQQDVTITVKTADVTNLCIEGSHASLDGVWHVTNQLPNVEEGACE
jgi:hypothetical protein